MSTLNRQDIAPPPGPKDEIVRCKPGEGFRGQILSREVWGVWTHWDGARTRECTMPSEECRGHIKSWPLRWKGYLNSWCSTRRKVVFVELTPAAAAEIKRQTPKGLDLRGLLIRLDRRGESMKSRITVELTTGAGGMDTLPEADSPEATLRALWGWKVSG